MQGEGFLLWLAGKGAGIIAPPMQSARIEPELQGEIKEVFDLGLKSHGKAGFGANARIFGGIVMQESEPEMRGQHVQPMRSEIRPVTLGELHAAQVGKVRIVEPAEIEAGPEHGKVEGGIVRDHPRTLEIGGEFEHDVGKLRGMGSVLGPDAVNGDVERRVAVLRWPDQALLDTHDTAVLDEGEADGEQALARASVAVSKSMAIVLPENGEMDMSKP